MSALRKSVTRPIFWILIAAAVIAVAAICDWARPSPNQFSVQLYARAIIGPYQRYVRPHTHRFFRCRFKPSCSQYSFYAMQAHGFPRGLWLTAKRVLRCTPWVPAGTEDPVPPALTQQSATAAP